LNTPAITPTELIEIEEALKEAFQVYYDGIPFKIEYTRAGMDQLHNVINNMLGNLIQVYERDFYISDNLSPRVLMTTDKESRTLDFKVSWWI